MDKIVNFVIYAYVTTIKKIFKFLVVFVLVFLKQDLTTQLRLALS